MDSLDTDESINKMQFNLITQGVWEVNKEKTYQAILEKLIATNDEYLEEFKAEKDDQIERIKQFIMFFSQHDNTYRLNAETFSEEGTFSISNKNQLHTVTEDMVVKHEFTYIILKLNEDELILDGDSEMYAFDKKRTL